MRLVQWSRIIAMAVVCAAAPRVALPVVGAELLMDVNQRIIPRSSNPNGWVRLGTRMLFTSGSYQQTPVWRTDGTPAGTIPFIAADGRGRALTGDTVNGRALMQVWQAGGDAFIAATDGTAAGTQTLFQLSTQGALSQMRVLGRTASDRLLLWSRHPQLGLRIWTTDGTAAGTSSIPVSFTMNTNAFPNELAPVVRGNRVFFQSYDEQSGGIEIWQTDGTLANTSIITDTDPTPTTPNNSNELLGAGADHIYFRANNPGTTGSEIWSYSLATDTAQLLVDFAPGHFDSSIYWLQPVAGGVIFQDQVQDTIWFASNSGGAATPLHAFYGGAEVLGRVGGRVLFGAYESVTDGTELWSSDGTATGTGKVHDFSPGADHTSVYLGPALSDTRAILRVYASGGPQIWSTDGTPAGSRRLTPSANVVFGNDPVFLTHDSGYPGELWKIDRTTEGVTSIPSPARGNYFSDFGQLATFNGSTDTTGIEPWITDGTVAGSRMLLDIEPQSTSDTGFVDKLTTVGGVAVFEADDGAHGFELWKTDGTAPGTMLVVDVLPGDGNAGVSRPRVSGGQVYFQNLDAIGYGLWRSDGTSAGSAPVRDGVPTQFHFAHASDPFACGEWLAPLGNSSLFVTHTDPFGNQLWATDGSAAGTRLVNAAAHGLNNGSELCGLQTHGSLVYYLLTDNGRKRLFRSDGTSAGTFKLTGDSTATQTGSVGELTAVGTRTYFILDDTTARLWSTDGTLAGTLPFTATGDAAGMPALRIVGAFNGALIVQRFSGNQLVVARLDVTTGALVDLMTPAPIAEDGVVTGGRMFFRCGGVCITDGTATGTSRVRQQDASTGLPTVGDLMPYHGAVYFISRPSMTTGLELWKSDGTAPGTVRITPDATGSERELTQPAVAGGRVVFGMSDPDIGRELWRVTSAQPTTAADAVSVIAGNSVVVDPLANDADSDGRLVVDGLTLTANPTNGTAALQANGTVRYTPNSGFLGTDTFKYRITDDTGNVSAETTATITVSAQPSPPGSGGGGGGRLDWLLLGVLAGLLAGHRIRRAGDFSRP